MRYTIQIFALLSAILSVYIFAHPVEAKEPENIPQLSLDRCNVLQAQNLLLFIDSNRYSRKNNPFYGAFEREIELMRIDHHLAAIAARQSRSIPPIVTRRPIRQLPQNPRIAAMQRQREAERNTRRSSFRPSLQEMRDPEVVSREFRDLIELGFSNIEAETATILKRPDAIYILARSEPIVKRFVEGCYRSEITSRNISVTRKLALEFADEKLKQVGTILSKMLDSRFENSKYFFENRIRQISNLDDVENFEDLYINNIGVRKIIAESGTLEQFTAKAANIKKEAEKQRIASEAALAKARELDWPSTGSEQISFIERGNFSKVSYSDYSMYMNVLGYFRYYSDTCLGNYKGPVTNIEETDRAFVGSYPRTVFYGRSRVTQFVNEYENRTYIAYKVKNSSLSFHTSARQSAGAYMLSYFGLNGFAGLLAGLNKLYSGGIQSAVEQAKAVSSKVAQVGCESAKQKEWERKLFNFYSAIKTLPVRKLDL